MEIIIPYMGSIGIGIIGLLFCLFFFPSIGLLDFPKRYGLKRPAIPYPGGVAIIASFFVSIFLFFPFLVSEHTHKLFIVLLGLFIITIVSFVDDRIQLSPLFRLIIQLGVAFFLVANGIYIEFLTNPTSIIAFHLPIWIGGGITILWIVGCMNAINWLDGVPNLSVMNGMISSLIIGTLSLSPIVNQPEIALMAFCFAGTLLPFVIGNIGKTRYILGDSGSMTIGFLLAVFSVFSGGKMATMLISMSMPIFDSMFVFIIRIVRKKSPFTGKDNLHLHDQLMLQKWKNWQIVLLYLSISVCLGVSVLFLETIGKIILIIGFATVFFLLRWVLLQDSEKKNQ